MSKEEAVGVKRKSREGSAAISKKRVVESEEETEAEEILMQSNEKPIKKSTSVAKSNNNVSADRHTDFVVITNKKTSKTSKNPNKPKSKAKLQPKNSVAVSIPVQPSTSVTPTADGATPLLPSVTALVPTPKSRTKLTVDTNHEPQNTEISAKEAEKVVRQDKPYSIGWKLLFILLGFVLSFLPFMFLCTNDTLALVALSGQSSVMKVIVKMGADVEVLNKGGETLLLEACRLGNERAVQLFLESGSSTEAVNKDGDTSLSVALRLGNLKIAKLLLQGGSNVEVKDKLKGDTLLIQAVRAGNYMNAKLLIEGGANLEAESKAGEVPLVMTFRTNQLHMARLFLDAGANTEVVIDGETLLNRAVFYNKVDKVQLLLGAEADIEAVGQKGVKPLMQAAMHGNQQIVKMILSKHPDTEARNDVSCSHIP